VQDYGIPVYAIQGANRELYYEHISKSLERRPHITMDDGGDLIDELHRMNQPDLLNNVLGGSEETTTGVKRHRARAADGALKFPVIAVNDARTKYLFDNQFGIGQSTLDGIIRAMNVLIGGKKVVVAGYGYGGRGLASRVQGLGGHVIVTEIDPVKALEAAIQGYSVMSMAEAAAIGDLFITVTGNLHVIDRQHFELMKDGAIICNTGHFNVEINIGALEELKQSKTRMTDRFVEKYVMPDGRRLFLLAEGRLVNIVCGDGHPASIMDMSFSGQALAAEYLVQHGKSLSNEVYSLPKELDDQVARMKLATMGITTDTETEEQLAYHEDYGAGT
jgi:adenosylhomocysteinase